MKNTYTSISIIGECMTEFSGSLFGKMNQYFGGDTLNTAVYLARLNQDKKYEVNYISSVGKDTLSDYMLDAWNHEGINTKNVLIDPVRTVGAYLIQLDEFGERSFTYWRSDSAAKYMMSHEDFHYVESSLERSDVIYLSGISLAILPHKDCDHLVSLLTQLSQQGKKIIFDTNHRPTLWHGHGGSQRAQEVYARVMAISELALLTDDDEMQLWGDKDARQILTRLASIGLKSVVLKQGKDGSTYHHFINNKSFTTEIEAPIKVVDTTSAGDSFNAGYLSGYLRGLTPEHCSDIANKLAGVVIQHKGALVQKELLNNVIEKVNEYE